MAIKLYIKDTGDKGKAIGSISKEQLETLVDLLEEEASEDRDYYIDKDILEYLADEGADESLLAILKPHVPEGDGIEIEWRDEA